MIGPNKSYLSLVEAEFVPETFIKDSPLRPSAAGTCERELFLKYKAWKNQTPVKSHDARVQRIFDLGFAVESVIIKDFLKLKNFKVMYSQQIMDHGPIQGTDQLLQGSMDWCLISEIHKCVLDAKSRGGNGSRTWDKDITEALQFGEELDSNGMIIKDVEEFVKLSKDHELVKNIIQLNVYGTSAFCSNRGINHCSIIRYNKLDSRWYEFRFNPNLTLLKYVKQKFERVANATSEEELQAECVPGSMRQRFCMSCGKRQFKPVKKFAEVDEAEVLPASELPQALQTSLSLQLRMLSSELGKDLQTWMLEKNISHIRVDSSSVLALELLKSPNPHYEFRLKQRKK